MYNVLWLASWYPCKTDAFAGDFIERHAMAVSGFVKLTVLFVTKDESLESGKFIVDKSITANLSVYKVYYGKKSNISFIEKIFSFKRYLHIQKKIYKQIEQEQGRPDIIHVHVAMKAGMLALYLKKRYSIQYLVTEHWSGYFKHSTPNVYTGNWIINKLNKEVLRQSSLLLPVTENLGTTINDNFTLVNYKVIPNVVDTDYFYPAPFIPQRFKFIHPSQMNSNKNPEGILRAFKIVKERGYDFELLMVGNMDGNLIANAEVLELYNTNVFFKQAISYKEVAREMQQSSALVLFSHYESLPCVILEALCCGLPVISSRVGGIAEVINDNNGILVESGSEEALANAICQLIDTYNTYNKKNIAANANAKFNYHVIGMAYFMQYQKLKNATI